MNSRLGSMISQETNRHQNKLEPLFPANPKSKRNNMKSSYRSTTILPNPNNIVLIKSEKKAENLEWKPSKKSKFGFVVENCDQIQN